MKEEEAKRLRKTLLREQLQELQDLELYVSQIQSPPKSRLIEKLKTMRKKG